MTTVTKIIYPTPNENLGDTSDADCRAYREWFAEQLRQEYPGAEIAVTARPGRVEISLDADDVDPSDAEDELREFGNRCWDRCPWETIGVDE